MNMLTTMAHEHHVQRLRDLSLITLSAILVPFSFCFIFLASGLHAFKACTSIQQRTDGKSRSQLKVLVTGVGMAKGLSLARLLHQAGCTVIGADSELHGVPSCGRFSRSVRQYHRLVDPTSRTNEYVNQVVQLVQDQGIKIWVSCSGVATAIQDAQLMEALEVRTECKSFQFDQACTTKLDNKLEFMDAVREFGLCSPWWYPIQSKCDIDAALDTILHQEAERPPNQLIVKNVGMDDYSRGSLPLLNTSEPQQMANVLSSLDVTGSASWVVQEYIQEQEEYCTHAVIIDGQVRAFVACPSSSILLHYTAMDPEDALCQAMVRFTQGKETLFGPLACHCSTLTRILFPRVNYSSALYLPPLRKLEYLLTNIFLTTKTLHPRCIKMQDGLPDT